MDIILGIFFSTNLLY